MTNTKETKKTYSTGIDWHRLTWALWSVVLITSHMGLIISINTWYPIAIIWTSVAELIIATLSFKIIKYKLSK